MGATPAAIFDQILNRAPTSPVQLQSQDLSGAGRCRRQAAGKRQRPPLSARLGPPRRPEADAARRRLRRPAATSVPGGRASMECAEGGRHGRRRCPRGRGRGMVGEERRRPGSGGDERAGPDDRPADGYRGALVVGELVSRRDAAGLRLHPERIDGHCRHVARGWRASSRRGRSQRRGHASLVAGRCPHRVHIRRWHRHERLLGAAHGRHAPENRADPLSVPGPVHVDWRPRLATVVSGWTASRVLATGALEQRGLVDG